MREPRRAESEQGGGKPPAARHGSSKIETGKPIAGSASDRNCARSLADDEAFSVVHLIDPRKDIRNLVRRLRRFTQRKRRNPEVTATRRMPADPRIRLRPCWGYAEKTRSSGALERTPDRLSTPCHGQATHHAERDDHTGEQ